ncbi:DUF2625 family protein [Kitasatospora sp. NPDC004614]|uniref:DUF2625 family protein n=1 Tax=unclassified Kitasatospora TaxID=2633591 RepID=UPI00367654AA
MRELDELIDVDDPAWPELRKALDGAPSVRVLPADEQEARRCLLQLQVTARSTLGALTLHTGGLLLDDGWLRVFGGGGPASLGRVNRFPATFDPAWHPGTGLVLAHDVLGGVFALNGHDPAAEGRPGTPGQVTYFAPDSLEWESLDVGHSAWLGWLLSGQWETFYDGLRWPGWREETAALAADEGIAVYPFLWSEQAHEDLAATSRKPVPMRELLGIAGEFAQQVGLPDPGFLGDV